MENGQPWAILWLEKSCAAKFFERLMATDLWSEVCPINLGRNLIRSGQVLSCGCLLRGAFP